MKIVKPKKLSKGDVIGIISPSSSPEDLSTINKGVQYLENLGYSVDVGKNVGKFRGYLAGDDNDRLTDLHNMFKNKNVKAVICVRGGYGSGRLLNKIDYKLIKDNPKIFVGYSDVTALQMAFLKKTGLVTFAGPMIAVDFCDSISQYTEEMFWALITSNKKYGKINLPNEEKIFGLTKGNAKGKFIGGNLATFTSLIGSDYLPSIKNTIPIFEDVGELPYKLDRMFNQLSLNNFFKEINGLILGTFHDCNEHDPAKKTLTLGEVISDYLSQLYIPVVYNFKHGHLKDNITVPFGIDVKINASRNTVEITENAVG